MYNPVIASAFHPAMSKQKNQQRKVISLDTLRSRTYVLVKRRIQIKVAVDCITQATPDSYSLALIDHEINQDKGRVLGYDRGHEHHHKLPSDAQCHKHSLGMKPIVPKDCGFFTILPLFLDEVTSYCNQLGLKPHELTPSELIEELRHA